MAANVHLFEGEAQYQAMQKADAAVRMGLGSNAPKDMPPIMRNNDLKKLLTTLGGFDSLKRNQAADVWGGFRNGGTPAQLVYGMIMAIHDPGCGGGRTSCGHRPQDGENVGSWLANRALLFSLQTVAILNLAVSALENHGEVNVSPAVNPVERGMKAIHRGTSDSPNKDSTGTGMDALQGGMEMLGVSGTDQAFRTAHYVRRALQGEIANPNVTDAIRDYAKPQK